MPEFRSLASPTLQLICIAAGGNLIAAAALAADTSAAATPPAAAETLLLDPFVLVETRTPTEFLQLSPSTSFVALDDRTIATGPFVTDALRDVPGLALVASGGPGAPVSLFSRGSESNHTAVLLNGRRLNPGLAGGYDLTSLTTDALARVEVLRGASSTLWGAEGIGGVVNLVTRDATRLEQPEVSLLAEAGSFATRRASLAAAAAHGAWSGELAGGYFQTDNEVPNSDYRLRTARGTVGFRPRAGLQLEMLASFSDGEGGSPGARTFPTPDDRFAQQAWSVSPGWMIESGDGTLRARGFYSFSHQRYRFVGPPWSDDLSVVANHEIDQQFDWAAREGLRVSGGLNWQRAAIEGESFGARVIDEQQTNLGVWTQAQFQPAPEWRVITGLRWDDYSAFESPVTWNVAVQRALAGGVSLHAKAATAYAPPSFQDLYYPGFNNPDLRAEESQAWEAGARWEGDQGRRRLDLVVFRSDLDNFIQFVSSVQNGVFVGRPENVAEARLTGVELSGATPLSETVSLNFSYTRLEAENRSADVQLLRRPKHLLAGSISVQPTAAWRVSLGGRWIAGWEDNSSVTFAQVGEPDYFVARLSATWQASERLEVFARVENLLDREYAEVDGYPALGRALHAGARVTF